MTEVISGGPPERPPADPRVRRAAGVLTAAAVLVAGTWVALHRTSTEPAAEHTTDAPRTPASAPPSLPSVRIAPAIEPTLSGVATGGPAGLRLLVGGPALTAVDAVTGARDPVDGVPLPAGRSIVQLVQVPSGTVVVVLPTPRDAGEAGWVYLLRRGRAALEVARADGVLPGLSSGRIWAYSYPPDGKRATLTALGTDGRVLSRRVLPEGWVPEADTEGGLLVSVHRGEGPGDLSTVDPVSLRVRQSLGQSTYVVAATSRQAAWVPATPEPGADDLMTVNFRTGRQRSYRVASGFSLGTSAFSPDGRQLAIAYHGRHGLVGNTGPEGTNTAAAPGFVEVLDLASGDRTRVPGVGTPEKQSADLSWSPDSRWLAIGVRWPEEGYQRIGLWPASHGPLLALPDKIPGGYVSALLAVTPDGTAP